MITTSLVTTAMDGDAAQESALQRVPDTSVDQEQEEAVPDTPADEEEDEYADMPDAKTKMLAMRQKPQPMDLVEVLE
jgi:hypothetical protein